MALERHGLVICVEAKGFMPWPYIRGPCSPYKHSVASDLQKGVNGYGFGGRFIGACCALLWKLKEKMAEIVEVTQYF